MVLASKLELAMKVQVSVRKGLEPLMRWVDFVYDESDAAQTPDLLDALTPPEQRDEVRTRARAILEKVASNRRKATRFHLPPRQTALLVTAHGLLAVDTWEFARDSLVPAFTQKIGPVRHLRFKFRNQPLQSREQEQAWQRLRLCGCGHAFVALIPRAEYCRRCSNRERQRKFYAAHTTQQRKIKLARYHMSRMRQAVAEKIALTKKTRPVLPRVK
jgi:hypothetical protein